MRLVGLMLVMVASVALNGCATTAQKSPIGEAVYYALQTDTTLRTWTQKCEGYGGQVRQLSWQARKNWWQRNGTFVESADYGLTRGVMKVSGSRDVTGANLALGITADIVDGAEKEVDGLLKASGNKEQLCIKMLTKFNDGDYDLRDNNNLYPVLVELQNQAEQNGGLLVEEKAALDLSKKRSFGRSLYAVEKLVKRNGCPGATVKILKNNWPHEVYDVQCPDKSYVLVQCEWGSCIMSD